MSAPTEPGADVFEGLKTSHLHHSWPCPGFYIGNYHQARIGTWECSCNTVTLTRTTLAAQIAAARSEGAREAAGLLEDLVTAKKLRLDAEEWQLVWDRVFRFLADRSAALPDGEEVRGNG